MVNIKLKATRPCRIAKNIDGKTHVWIFDNSNDIIEVEEDYVKILLDTGIIKKIKEEEVKEVIEKDG